MLLLPAVNYSSPLSPPPFPSAISPQSCTADHWKVLILKFTQTPNTFGTIVLVFMQQQNHFMQKSHKTSHCAQYTHKKYKTYTIIVMCCFFSQQNNIYTSQHQYICYRKHSFKIRPNSQRKTHRGCKLSIPFWLEGLSCKLWKCAQYIHKTYKTKQHWKTANMHHNINMFTTGNTHLKYRKHRVHSAAHKLKIRSSRLVLTTAGTDLDSTDRAAIGELKIAQPVSR